MLRITQEPDLYTDHHKRDQYDNYTVPIYSSEFQAAINGLENTPSGNVISRGPSVAAPTICCNWVSLLRYIIEKNTTDEL